MLCLLGAVRLRAFLHLQVFAVLVFTVLVLEFPKSNEYIQNLVFRIWHLTCATVFPHQKPTSCQPSRPFSSSIIPVTYVSPTTFTDPCLQQKINMFPAVVCGQKPYNLGQYPTIKRWQNWRVRTCVTWVCLRSNGGLMVVYHCTNQKNILKQIRGHLGSF